MNVARDTDIGTCVSALGLGLALVALPACGGAFSASGDGDAGDVDADARGEQLGDEQGRDGDRVDAGVDVDQGDAGDGDGCVMPGLWCYVDGGEFIPCNLLGNEGGFTCNGSTCSASTCTQGGPCIIKEGTNVDGGPFIVNGTVTGCAP